MKTAIVDYGTGNLGSVRRALTELGGNPFVASCPDELDLATKIVLPGVGSFADGMASLRKGGWEEAIKRQVHDRQKFLLGICLGMQLLATQGEEGLEEGNTNGLDLIPGGIIRLDKLGCQMRIPHVGWNDIKTLQPGPLFADIPNETDFYFVHSYSFKPEDEAHVLATCNYGTDLVASLGRGRVMGTQFHPEKSSGAGKQLLKNFLGMSLC